MLFCCPFWVQWLPNMTMQVINRKYYDAVQCINLHNTMRWVSGWSSTDLSPLVTRKPSASSNMITLSPSGLYFGISLIPSGPRASLGHITLTLIAVLHLSFRTHTPVTRSAGLCSSYAPLISYLLHIICIGWMIASSLSQVSCYVLGTTRLL